MTATNIIVIALFFYAAHLVDKHRNKKRKQKVVKTDYDPTEDFYHPN